MNYTKKDAINVVVTCAEKYKTELEGKNLLFICIDKHKETTYIEFSFHDYNFMHLTGLKTKIQSGQGVILSAVDFYKRCLEHKLSESDFEFSDDGTSPMKLDVLPSVICKNLSANMIGCFASSHPKMYTEKIAGGTKAYMGFVKDSISKEYVPNTIVKEDLRNSVSDYMRVLATYRKNQDAKKYFERVYIANRVEWSKIEYPEKFSYLPKPQ